MTDNQERPDRAPRTITLCNTGAYVKRFRAAHGRDPTEEEIVEWRGGK